MSESSEIQQTTTQPLELRSGPSIKRGKSKQDYRTPDDFREAIIKRFGVPIWDLAADNSNRFAPPDNFFGPGGASPDALTMSWQTFNGVVFLNPPFSDIAPWARKCRDTCLGRFRPVILFLVPASVGANWFQDYIHNFARVHFLNPRLSFDGSDPYPRDLILAEFGAFPASYEIWRWK